MESTRAAGGPAGMDQELYAASGDAWDQTQASKRARRLEPGQLEDHRGRLFRAAYALCRSREDAEDLVQEAYEHVLRRPRFLRSDNDIVYLLRVLRSRWQALAQSSAYRRSSPVAPEELEWVAADSAEDAGARALEVKAAYAAIGELSEPLRETLVAVDIVGLSYREAARALGVRTGTIMSRLFRARERVAAALEGS